MYSLIKFSILIFLCNICIGKPRINSEVKGIEDEPSRAFYDFVLQSQEGNTGIWSSQKNNFKHSPKMSKYATRTRLKVAKTRVKLKQFVENSSFNDSQFKPPQTSGTNYSYLTSYNRTEDYGNNNAQGGSDRVNEESERFMYDSARTKVHVKDSDVDYDSNRPIAATSGENIGAAREFSRHVVVIPKIFCSRTKRELMHTREKDGHKHHISLGLTIGEEDIVVDLQLNRDLLTRDFFEKHRTKGSHTIKRPKPENVDFCHYQGVIKDRPGSWAALSTCEGVRGVVFDGTEFHYLEPIPQMLTAITEPHYLLSHKDLLANNLTCGYKGKPHPFTDLFHDKEFTRLLRYKRDTTAGPIRGPFNSDVHSRYVELILVADRAEFEKHNSDVKKIHRRFKDIANIVNALYQPLNIFIALVGVEVWQDEDPVKISTNGDTTLTNFLNYRKVRLIPDHPNDNAQLLTGKTFDSGVVGKALKGPICTYQYSGGVNMDHSDSVGLVATTVAHEMGHNFGMEHDTDEDCKCPDKRCIMAPSSGTRSPSHWSSCSHEYLAISFERSMDYCLRNKPTRLFESPVCGNGFVEPGEQCDCGLSQYCNNPCCNASSCMLFANATCATGHCCDLRTCRPKEAGIKCRSALHECDLPEFCSGDSEYCPDNFYKEDGQSCLGGKAYCYKGMCRTHEHQCRLLWGPTGKNSHDKCYNLNREGNTNGNCGYNWADKSYKRCNTQDIKCGMMHCKHFNERLEFGMESVSKVSHRFIADKKQGVIPCRVAQVDLGLDMVDPGLAPDGAKCGYKRMCVDQRCMQVSSLRVHYCDCNRQGVCNNMGNCHCDIGFASPNCNTPGYGGSINSGPASNPHASSRFVLYLFLMFAGVFLVMMMILCLLYSRGKLKLVWLRKGIPATSRLSRLEGVSRKTRSHTSAGNKATPTEPVSVNGQSSPQSSQGSKTNSPLLNGISNGIAGTAQLINKYKGFNASPTKDKFTVNGGLTNPLATSPSWKPNQLPANVWPPSSPKINISDPSLRASTNPTVVNSGTVVVRPAPSPPDNLPSVALLTPSRRAPPRPKSVPDASVLLNSNVASLIESESMEKDQCKSSAMSKIASFLSKKETSCSSSPSKDVAQPGQCNTLPRKAAKINRESLLQLEISNPMQLQATELPSNLVPVRMAPVPPGTAGTPVKVSWAPSVADPPPSDLLRIGSVRESNTTNRPSIPRFGSMRTPRPKSIPPARPSQPPPRPPLPTIPGMSESEYTYDDCVMLQHANDVPLTEGEKIIPQEEIYATIDEESPPPKEEKKKSMFSMLYSKAKKKKALVNSPEPLYCNIDKSNDVTPETPSTASLENASQRGSVEENGLLSEIVSELVNREPQYMNTLANKCSPTKKLIEGTSDNNKNKLSEVPIAPKTISSFFQSKAVNKAPEKNPKQSNSSPELSRAAISKTLTTTAMPSYSNVKPRGVISFFKSASVDEPTFSGEKKSTIVTDGEMTEVKSSSSIQTSLASSLAGVKEASLEAKKAVNKSKTELKLLKSSPTVPPSLPGSEPKVSAQNATKTAISRPTFPPDKVVFPPDKIMHNQPTSLSSVKARSNAATKMESTNSTVKPVISPKDSEHFTSPKKSKQLTSPKDSKPLTSSVEKTKPTCGKKPLIVAKVDSGNRGRSITSSLKLKDTNIQKNFLANSQKVSSKTDPDSPPKPEISREKDSTEASSSSSLRDSSRKKAPLFKPSSSTSSTAKVLSSTAAKPKGSSHVASLQQKFELQKSAPKKD